jgi:hypothetical protein
MTAPDPSGSRAVLIGTHTGCHTLGEWAQDLPGVAENLTELRKVLTEGPVWQLDPEHCTYLPQPNDPRVVLRAVEKAAAEATDTLLVYLAGHGLLDESNRLYLALPGATAEYDCLSYDHLRRCIRRNRSAPRTIVIVDCCYSGQALEGTMGNTPRSYEEVVKNNTLIAGACVLTASAATRNAIAPPGERFTAFTGELIALLREGIPGGPKYLDMATIYDELHHRLDRPGIPEPQFGTSAHGARMVFARNPAYQEPANEPPEPPPGKVPTEALRKAGEALSSKTLANRMVGIAELDRLATVYPDDCPVIAEELAKFLREQTQEIPEDSRSVPEDVQASLDIIRTIGGDNLDLGGTRLSGGNLSGMSLRGASLDGADLSHANLAYTRLRGASLVDASLISANLDRADLTDADLRFANLTGASTEDVDVQYVLLDDATLNDDLHEKIHEAMRYDAFHRMTAQYPYVW